MKILCSISGLEFDCEHFPGTFHSKETFHPLFCLPQKRLLSAIPKWVSGELTKTDSYLLFLAILRSSDQVDFRVPAFRTPHTDAIIAQNMEYLVRTVIKLNAVVNPAVFFPHFAITQETRFLTNVRFWIEAWDERYKEFVAGKEKDYENRALVKREAALQRMIKNPHKNVREYANQLAEWAATAGNFPEFKTRSPWGNAEITLSELWKNIIVRCTKSEHLYSIPAKDLKELIDHCENVIDVGSIYSNTLFRVFRSAQEKQKNFLGLGDMDASETPYELLSDSDSIQDANILAMINSAPHEEPRAEMYKTNFEFLRAKARWNVAIRYGKRKAS